jgi:pyruvate dehydrogenase E1 component beta subunit
VPGLKVVMPYSAADAKGLLKAAIRDPNPVIFLENEILYGKTFEVPELDDFHVPIGKAKDRARGTDVTIVFGASAWAMRWQAADRAGRHGIEAEVIDLRTLAPAGYRPRSSPR